MSGVRERLMQRGLLGGRRRSCRRIIKDKAAVYHVMSRTVHGSFWFNDRAKEVFRKMVRKQAAFTGVEVLTYCVMNNHFHLLLRVPECPLQENGEHLLSDEEILRRYAQFYGKERPTSTFSVDELVAAFNEGGDTAEFARRTVLARMGSLSAFMKELKQRFVIWFNHTNETCGTIWSERYKSILVENRIEVMTRVAAYIDLNPLRATLVSDPAKYRWSGYGEAMRGSLEARACLSLMYGTPVADYAEVIEAYRLILFGVGAEGPHRRNSEAERRIDPEALRQVLDSGGKVSWAEVLSIRIQHFTESIALGSEAFLQECGDRFGRRGLTRHKCWTGWQRICGMVKD